MATKQPFLVKPKAWEVRLAVLLLHRSTQCRGSGAAGSENSAPGDGLWIFKVGKFTLTYNFWESWASSGQGTVPGKRNTLQCKLDNNLVPREHCWCFCSPRSCVHNNLSYLCADEESFTSSHHRFYQSTFFTMFVCLSGWVFFLVGVLSKSVFYWDNHKQWTARAFTPSPWARAV